MRSVPSREHPEILYDGECGFCNRVVGFVRKRDPRESFRFAALQSDASKSLLRSVGASRDKHPESIVLIEGGRAQMRSTAALLIARRLRFPWPLLYAFIVVPRPIRDWIYDFIASHRYGFSGRRRP